MLKRQSYTKFVPIACATWAKFLPTLGDLANGRQLADNANSASEVELREVRLARRT